MRKFQKLEETERDKERERVRQREMGTENVQLREIGKAVFKRSR